MGISNEAFPARATMTVEQAFVALAGNVIPMPQEARAALLVLREHIHALAHITIPPGWKLVPVEPTEEMIQACVARWQARLRKKAENGTLLCGGNARKSFTENYTAMLEVSPQPPWTRA